MESKKLDQTINDGIKLNDADLLSNPNAWNLSDILIGNSTGTIQIMGSIVVDSAAR